MRAAILILALAACSPSHDAAAPNEEEAHPATSEGLMDLPIGATAPRSLEGEWRVAGVNREIIDIEWAMTASIDEDSISIQSQCMGFSRMYALDGTMLTMPEVPPAPEGTLPTQPPPVCARTFLPEEQAVSKALQGATVAYRLPDRSLVLDGTGGSLTFYTQ